MLCCAVPCRYGYFKALPPREYLPLFWGDAELALLRGTELEADRVEADRCEGARCKCLSFPDVSVVGQAAAENWVEGYQGCCPCWLQGHGTPPFPFQHACRQAAAEDFEEHVLPLLSKYPGRLRPDFITLHNFNVAASFVASRAFGVDEWHGGWATVSGTGRAGGWLPVSCAGMNRPRGKFRSCTHSLCSMLVEVAAVPGRQEHPGKSNT